MNIKGIIFDLGGVLFRIRYEESFIQLGELLHRDLRVGNWPEVFKQMVFDYETGKIGTDAFLNFLQRYSHGKTPSVNALISAWNSMLIDWNELVFETLEQLKEKYEIFLLSNINSLHVKYLEHNLSDSGGRKYLNNFFNEIFFSHEIGTRKPAPEAYYSILKATNLKPSELIFIDDYIGNVDMSTKMGIASFLHPANTSIINTLKSAGVDIKGL